MDLKYRKYYIDILNRYINGENIKKYKVYEILYALQYHNYILWDDIPPNFEDKFDIPHRRDYGIDLISLDYTTTAQVKLYSSKSTVTWRSISTFYTYTNGLMNINDMKLLTTTDTKIDKLVMKIHFQMEYLYQSIGVILNIFKEVKI